jgi:hypothetical protein
VTTSVAVIVALVVTVSVAVISVAVTSIVELIGSVADCGGM